MPGSGEDFFKCLNMGTFFSLHFPSLHPRWEVILSPHPPDKSPYNSYSLGFSRLLVVTIACAIKKRVQPCRRHPKPTCFNPIYHQKTTPEQNMQKLVKNQVARTCSPHERSAMKKLHPAMSTTPRTDAFQPQLSRKTTNSQKRWCDVM